MKASMVVFRGISGLLPPPSGGQIFPVKNGHIFVKMVVFGKKWGFAYTDFDFLILFYLLIRFGPEYTLKNPNPRMFFGKNLHLHARNKIH